MAPKPKKPAAQAPPPRKPPIKIILRTKSSMAQVNSETTTAAAQAFDSVMQEHNLENGTSVGGVSAQVDGTADRDVIMSDTPPARHISPAILPGATLETYRGGTVQNPTQSTANTGNLTPARTPSHPSTTAAAAPALSTQTSNLQETTNSRATSQHPEPAQERTASFPKVAAVHGAPTRQYLNGKVTTVLLEGMKIIARDQPKDPLKVLGEYLLQRSKEVEGS